MPDTMRCFVNERSLALAPGATVQDAVTAFDAAMAARLAGGTAYVTDARGIRVTSDQRIEGGAILRVVVSARAATDDPDA
ncbi:MAG TPA: hypothetical protein VL295_07555 [Gemmatimonadales bacterium]|jgi:predicted secreted protein|nr:hypothetical protein [Gemmatimonadales bacterium]